MSEVSPTFCILPWIHMATLTDGSAVLCCVAKNDLKLDLNKISLKQVWNSDEFKNVRLKMLKGEKISSCVHCYKEEASGYRSHRLTENREWQRRFSEGEFQKIVQETRPDGGIDSSIHSIDLRLGNTCNLACIMCRPQDSSKWTGLSMKMENTVRERKLFNDFETKAQLNTSKYDWFRRPEIWEDLKDSFSSIRELIIGGGEPMLLEEHRKLIEYCVQTGHASHILLRYHTNGTILDPKIFDLWRHFKLVEVFVSLDGIGERNHYMRYPSPWSTIEKNLQRLDQYPHGNLDVALLCSVHVMSAFYLDEYAQWIQNQNFQNINRRIEGYFHPGIVHFPSHLSVQALPTRTKDLIRDKLLRFEEQSGKPSSKIHGVIGFMYENDLPQQLKLTREYFRALDVTRKTSFAKVMPELYNEIYT